CRLSKYDSNDHLLSAKRTGDRGRQHQREHRDTDWRWGDRQHNQSLRRHEPSWHDHGGRRGHMDLYHRPAFNGYPCLNCYGDGPGWPDQRQFEPNEPHYRVYSSSWRSNGYLANRITREWRPRYRQYGDSNAQFQRAGDGCKRHPDAYP